MRDAARTNETKTVTLVKRDEMTLRQQQHLLHIGMMTNLFKVCSHHGGTQTLSPVRRINNDTVNAKYVAKGVVAPHDVLGDGACIIRGCCGDDEADEIFDTVEKSDIAEVFGDDSTVLKIEAGGCFVGGVGGGFETNDTTEVDDFNLLQRETGRAGRLGHSGDEFCEVKNDGGGGRGRGVGRGEFRKWV